MLKAWNSSLSYLAISVALSSLSAPVKAAPQPSDTSASLPTTQTSVSNLIDRQDAAVTLQQNLVSGSSAIL